VKLKSATVRGSCAAECDQGLISAARRTTEEWVTEDWAAVSKAMNERMAELGMKQRELAELSGVSLANVREIQHNKIQRKRSRRTLEALSTALGWHPGHIAAVLHGRKPLQPGQTGEVTDEIRARLSVIEDRLDDITERLDTITQHLSAMANQPDRRDRR
jgi:transcriptional regulator with XRE-family HTH domain